jgi:HK97 gp10 family phage protein
MRIEADLAEFNDRMAHLSENMNNLESAYTDFAERVVAAARSSVPVRTGTLRDSIGYELLPNGVSIFANTPYAIFVEYGTVNMAAQPFLETNIRSNMQSLMNSISKDLVK